MNDPRFWGQALFQGGGLGILGDFLKSSTDRNNNSLQMTAAGPLASDLVQGATIVKEGYKSARGQPNHVGREVLRQIKADLPGGSLWYAKLAFQRAMIDQMQRQVDPEYSESFARMRNKAEQNGTGNYWQPGEMAPARAPDLTNVGKPAPMQ